MKLNCDIKGIGLGKSFGLIFFILFIGIAARAQPDYPPANWSAAYSGHWYTTGNGHKFVVIHDMEGYYLSTISYIQQSSTQVSIHYCVNGLQNGSDSQGHAENKPNDVPAGDITQMVREQYYGWHALCLNRWSFGTEHEGFAGNPAWYTEAMYQASAGLQRHLCDTWGIPKDRNHIIGHGEWWSSAWADWMAINYSSIDANCNDHTDPGIYWNWGHFMSLIAGVPAVPANLNALSLSTNQIKLTWTDASTNESGFRVERSPVPVGPWTLVASLPANSSSYTNSGLGGATTFHYRVYATSTNGNSVQSNVRGATTANSPPVLTAVGNKATTEGKPLAFTAKATNAALGVNTLITDFESYTKGPSRMLFQHPAYSGSSRGLDTSVATSTTVVKSFPAGHASTRALKVSWAFAAGAVDPWLRLTTAGAPGGFGNPVVDLRQIIKFDIYTDKALKVGVGLRETGNAAGTLIGSDGGQANGIEWIGVPNATTNGTPVPGRTVPAGSWQTLQFNIPYEPCRSFSGGNGVVTSATGLGVLEHLAFTPVAGGSGTYNVYLDNFSVVYSNVVSFSLDAGAPAGATIDSRTGAFSWTPSEAQGPGVYNVTVRVRDNASPALTDFETISVAVDETNVAPSLVAISGRSVVEGSLLTFTASATDGDIPANVLTYSLHSGAPAGAGIDSTTGVFSWTPTEEQGPGSYPITVRVTDNAPDSLSSTRTFTVAVTESNLAPVIAAVSDREIAPGTTLVISNSASDADLPSNALTFSLDPGAASGASVNPNSGVFTWTPSASQSESTNLFSLRVTDSGIPELSSATMFHVVVGTNPPPPIIATASISGESITIQWNSIATNTYRVLYTDDPSTTNWNTLGSDVIAAGASSSITDSLGTGRRFYRVKKMESE